MINYKLISDSVSYYERHGGYQPIEVPWYVNKHIIDITKPKDRTEDNTFSISPNEQMLIGSAEQGFLALGYEGRLPNGFYQSVSPCFRNETVDELHQKCFMKNELIIVSESPSKFMVEVMLNTAYGFFKTKVPNLNLLKLVKTIEGYDINYGDIELGSYGQRECDFMKWIYGTACAEPRLSLAIARNGIV